MSPVYSVSQNLSNPSAQHSLLDVLIGESCTVGGL